MSPTNYTGKNDDEQKDDIFQLSNHIIPDIIQEHLKLIKQKEITTGVRSYENFLKKIKDKNRYGVWFKMPKHFSDAILKILENEKNSLLRKYCQYKKLFVRGGEVFGSIWVNGEEELFESLDKKFIEDEKLTKYVQKAKELGDNKYVRITHGSAINEKFFQNIEINDNWPRMTFVQGKHDNCFRRSLQSSLIYFSKRFEKTCYNRKLIMECINCINCVDKNIVGEKLAHTINQVMKNSGFHCDRFPGYSKKRKRKMVKSKFFNKQLNIFLDTKQKGNITIANICGNHNNESHTISIVDGEWIFDSNFSHAMPLEQKYLDECCSSVSSYPVVYEKCILAYKYVFFNI